VGRTRWLTKDEEQTWRQYRRMRTLLDLAISRDLRTDSGLSDADYDVLSTLSEVDGDRWRARDLAAHLLWSTSRLAHQVGRMESRGLVRRSGVREDGRGATVALTAAGRRALQDAAPAHLESVRRNLVDLLSPAELRTLGRIASRVVDRLDPAGSTE
jgi:DNA-binding MarR family transcriptional regulator